MNVEIVLNNTVNKTVIEFNYFIHNCLDTGNLANDEERLRRDGIIRRQTILLDSAQSEMKIAIIHQSVFGTKGH